MKWLLITTIGKNPGDEWIRMGIQALIRSVDKKAQFILIDKEDKKNFDKPVAFDRAVWCGMPLFWSHGDTEWRQNFTCPWWKELLMGWVSEDPRKLLVMGAGTFFGEKIHDISGVKTSLKALRKRSFGITFRDSVLSTAEMPCLPCPALFALKDMMVGVESNFQMMKIANLMPSGSHYKSINPEESEIWGKRVKHLVPGMVKESFVFLAHNDAEHKFALQLEWPSTLIARIDRKTGLQMYLRGCKYFGNRIHGGVMARAAGAETLAVGFCTRLEMVRNVGGATIMPSEIDVPALLKWFKRKPVRQRLDMNKLFEEQRTIVAEFAEG